MNGFDTTQLDKFSKDLLNTAKNEYPKETKKFLRKEGRKLTKLIKGNYNIRSYGGGLHNLLNNGYTHKGGRDKTGKETWIEGHHYIEKSQNEFENQYYTDIDSFIDSLFD